MTNRTWTTIFLVAAGILTLFILSFVFFGESGQLGVIFIWGIVGGILLFLIGMAISAICQATTGPMKYSKNVMTSLVIFSLAISFFSGFLFVESFIPTVLDSGDRVELRESRGVFTLRNPWTTKIDGHAQVRFDHISHFGFMVLGGDGKTLLVRLEAQCRFEIPKDNRVFSKEEWVSLDLSAEREKTEIIFGNLVTNIMATFEGQLNDGLTFVFPEKEKAVYENCLYKPMSNKPDIIVEVVSVTYR